MKEKESEREKENEVELKCGKKFVEVCHFYTSFNFLQTQSTHHFTTNTIIFLFFFLFFKFHFFFHF